MAGSLSSPRPRRRGLEDWLAGVARACGPWLRLSQRSGGSSDLAASLWCLFPPKQYLCNNGSYILYKSSYCLPTVFPAFSLGQFVWLPWMVVV